MTADIRTAAQREAAEKFHWLNRDAKITSITAFVSGAVWAQARVTPTREQIKVVALKCFHPPDDNHGSWWINTDEIADEVAALIAGLAEGEDNGEHE